MDFLLRKAAWGEVDTREEVEKEDEARNKCCDDLYQKLLVVALQSLYSSQTYQTLPVCHLLMFCEWMLNRWVLDVELSKEWFGSKTNCEDIYLTGNAYGPISSVPGDVL